ncbi:MAG: hypothetical protein LBM62_02120 [Mediterranea sp.]|jgi:N-acetylglucosamine kinase-like BadF-type ATPase|nr:hypothetical protein [Mediterranea sp.]
MELIVESSSARTEWVLTEKGVPADHAFSEGINPFLQTRREISRSVRLNLPDTFFKRKLKKVYFYGIGCTIDSKKEMVESSLIAQFKSRVEVESDLLGASRGLFGNKPGIVCIIGSDSSSCFYDGTHIAKNVLSGGYVLDGEGGGSMLGKLFLSDVLKELAPAEIMEAFYDKFRIIPANILESVYHLPNPSRFLGTVAYFLAEYTDNEYVHNLIAGNFRRFFERNIMQYDYHSYPIRVIGSLAFDCSSILTDTVEKLGISISKIQATSMKGLIKYHAAY